MKTKTTYVRGIEQEIYEPETIDDALAIVTSASDVPYNSRSYAAAHEWLRKHAIDDERIFRAYVVQQLKSMSLDLWRLKKGRGIS